MRHPINGQLAGQEPFYEGGSGIAKGQEYKITVSVDGGQNCNDYQITVTPTGTPKYTAITSSGKTLADAGLTVEGAAPSAFPAPWPGNSPIP